MYGAEFVHVVALVAARACIHEGEQACDEERGLVVGDGEGTCEDGARLAVLLLTVAEEEAVRSRIAMAERARLTDIDAGERGAVLNGGTVLNDEVVGNDTVADMDGCLLTAVERSVLQAAGTFDLRVRAHVHILYITGIDNRHMLGNGTPRAGALGCALGSKPLELGDELGAMTVECFEISFVSGEPVVDRDLAATRLVHHCHLYPIAETAGAVAEDDIDVLDETVVGDIVVGNIVLDVLDAAVVAYRDVVQRGIEDARVLVDAAGHLEALHEGTDSHITREAGVTDILEAGLVGHLHAQPVVRRASLLHEPRDLCLC